MDAELVNNASCARISITESGCVAQVCMGRLQPQELHTVDVCGERRQKWFQVLIIDDQVAYADVITGRVYKSDGTTSSSIHLRIIK